MWLSAGNKLEQVVYTNVPPSTSSIIWMVLTNGSDALHLGR